MKTVTKELDQKHSKAPVISSLHFKLSISLWTAHTAQDLCTTVGKQDPCKVGYGTLFIIKELDEEIWMFSSLQEYCDVLV